MYKIWIGSHTSLSWFLRGSSILFELEFVGFCWRRKTGEFGKEGSEKGYANPLVRAFFAKCASVKILSKSETTNTSANPLDLLLKSSIRELYKAKSVDPKTYSPTSKNLHNTYDCDGNLAVKTYETMTWQQIFNFIKSWPKKETLFHLYFHSQKNVSVYKTIGDSCK